MKKNLFTAVFILLANMLLAGNDSQMLMQDITLMQKRLGGNSHFSATIDVVNKGEQLALPTIHAVIKRKGDSVYYKVMQFEYLFTDKHTIMVDHKKKMIAYTTPSSKSKTGSLDFLPDLDSIYQGYDSVEYIGLVNGNRKYRVHNGNGVIELAEIYFDPVTQFFSKMVYTYNKEITGNATVLAVEYSNVRYDEVFTNQFDEDQFIIQKGKVITPAPVLTGYTITEAQTSNDNF